MTGQMGHVQGTDGTQTGGCPAKILYGYWFFLSLAKRKTNKHEIWRDASISGLQPSRGPWKCPLCPADYLQRKTKGQQLKSKIVSEFSHLSTIFHTFAYFFPQDFPLQSKGFGSRRTKENKRESKEQDKSMSHVSCCTFVLLLYLSNLCGIMHKIRPGRPGCPGDSPPTVPDTLLRHTDHLVPLCVLCLSVFFN